jgi:hypothetical protein
MKNSPIKNMPKFLPFGSMECNEYSSRVLKHMICNVEGWLNIKCHPYRVITEKDFTTEFREWGRDSLDHF